MSALKCVSRHPRRCCADPKRRELILNPLKHGLGRSGVQPLIRQSRDDRDMSIPLQLQVCDFPVQGIEPLFRRSYQDLSAPRLLWR